MKEQFDVAATFDEGKVIPKHSSKYNVEYLNVKKQAEDVQKELKEITKQIKSLENDESYKSYIEAHNYLSKHLEDKGKNKLEEINQRFEPFKGAINAFSLAEESKYAKIIEKNLERYEQVSFEISGLQEQAKKHEETLVALNSKLKTKAKQLNRNDSATVVDSGISVRKLDEPIKTKNPYFLFPAIDNSPVMPKFKQVTKEAEDIKNSTNPKAVTRTRSRSS